MPKILYTRHRRILRQLLDALIRRKLPVGPDAPDADAPDALYQHLDTIRVVNGLRRVSCLGVGKVRPVRLRPVRLGPRVICV